MSLDELERVLSLMGEYYGGESAEPYPRHDGLTVAKASKTPHVHHPDWETSPEPGVMARCPQCGATMTQEEFDAPGDHHEDRAPLHALAEKLWRPCTRPSEAS